MQQLDGETSEEIQALFREVNERVFQLELGRRRADFVCECADPQCSEPLTLDAEVFERVRERPGRYIVCLGHLQAGSTRTVEEHEGFAIVERSRDEGPIPIEARAAA